MEQGRLVMEDETAKPREKFNRSRNMRGKSIQHTIGGSAPSEMTIYDHAVWGLNQCISGIDNSTNGNDKRDSSSSDEAAIDTSDEMVNNSDNNPQIDGNSYDIDESSNLIVGEHTARRPRVVMDDAVPSTSR